MLSRRHRSTLSACRAPWATPVLLTRPWGGLGPRIKAPANLLS
jgi:hypothetical protein